MSQDEPGLRERKKRALREALYDSALTLFRRDGFDAVPVSAICAASGAAKGTFFNHFPTKDHVLLEWYERLSSDANAAKFPPGPLLDRLINLTEGFFAVTLADPDLWRAKQQRAALSEDFRKAELASDVRTRAVVETLITDALEAGELRDGLNPGALSDMVVALLTGTVHDWTLSNGQLDVRALVRERLTTLVTALAK